MSEEKLNELNNRFARFEGEVTTGIKNICKKIDDMERKRDEGSKEHWRKLNQLHDDLHTEQTARIAGDTINNTETKVLKTKITAWATLLSILFNQAIWYIRSKFL